MSNLFKPREYYKPFDYPWAFDYYRKQSSEMHWVPEDVPLHEDIRDWNTKLSPVQKEVVTQILNLFTQSDVDVGAAYYEKFIPMFPVPEIRMMLGAFANMESVHQHAYSHFTDTIGLPVSTYKAFYEYEAMRDKHDYLSLLTSDYSASNVLKNIAIYSAFTEGMQLFSSFAILLKFPHEGLMKGMGQIVSYSIKDESVHVEGMIRLFHEVKKENMGAWDDSCKEAVKDAAEVMCNLEHRFVDKVFEIGDLPNLRKGDVKRYNMYIADRRLLQLGLEPIFGVKDNPLPFISEVLGVEFADFFSTRATAYMKGGLKGNRTSVTFPPPVSPSVVYPF
jgi:ribonucleoside-diphosphate reductase beta chain